MEVEVSSLAECPPVTHVEFREPRTTRQLAEFIVGTPYERIDAAAVHATKRLILDGIIVTAAAINTPMAKALLALKTGQGGAAEATLIVDGGKVPAASAAYVHTQLANLLDADETLLNRMHTVAASTMSALAMAERLGSSGKALIAASAIGFDITARIGLSLRQYVPNSQGGLDFAPIFGWGWMSFGAAATTGRLLELDALQMARALGQALITSPVNWDIPKNNLRMLAPGRPASWHKSQMGGAMAEAGINAALLASLGWVAQDDVLDEGSEFWRSFAVPGCDWPTIFDNLGEHWYIADTSIKPYPFCRFGHAALDIIADLVARHGISADDVENVKMLVAPTELSEMLAKTVEIDEPLKLMISQPTAIALLLLGIPIGPKWFEADLTSDRVRSLAHRVTYEVNPKWAPVLTQQMKQEGSFRRIPTEVTIRTRSGREYSGSAEYALGDPWGANMSDERLAEKARQYLDGILPAAKIEGLVAAVLDVDTAADISAIVAAMTR